MTEKEFEMKVKKDAYQVFLFSCPATMPFSFATHPWFVINGKGEVSRWEILWRPQDWIFRWGHLHKNFYPPTQGIEKFYFSERFFWHNVSLIGLIEGNEDSLAHRMADCIESSPDTYPFCDHYALRGPNSNTYVQWVLDHFPECTLRLPRNALGKKFRG